LVTVSEKKGEEVELKPATETSKKRSEETVKKTPIKREVPELKKGVTDRHG